METTIYYFSGTGNSLTAAEILSDELGNCTLTPMTHLWESYRIVPPTPRFGLVFPLYYFGLPLVVDQFVRNLEFHSDTYGFALITRGGSNGIAIEQIQKILGKRLKELSSGFYVTMPGNYIPLYDVAPPEKQAQILEKAHEKIRHIGRLISSGSKEVDRQQFSFKPFSKVVYKAWAKKANYCDDEFYADENCTSCELCSRVCPVGNISMNKGRPQWHNRCQECLACVHFCPQKAIQIGKKTIRRGRYHHPDVTAEDISEQKPGEPT